MYKFVVFLFLFLYVDDWFRWHILHNTYLTYFLRFIHCAILWWWWWFLCNICCILSSLDAFHTNRQKFSTSAWADCDSNGSDVGSNRCSRRACWQIVWSQRSVFICFFLFVVFFLHFYTSFRVRYVATYLAFAPHHTGQAFPHRKKSTLEYVVVVFLSSSTCFFFCFCFINYSKWWLSNKLLSAYFHRDSMNSFSPIL